MSAYTARCTCCEDCGVTHLTSRLYYTFPNVFRFTSADKGQYNINWAMVDSNEGQGSGSLHIFIADANDLSTSSPHVTGVAANPAHQFQT